MRRAESSAAKIGLIAIVTGCFFLGGCGTLYLVDIENHNEGNGTLISAADSKGELDGEQNATLPIGDGSVGAAGSLLDRITPNVLKPVKIDNSVKDSNNQEVKPEPMTPPPAPDEVVIDEVDTVEEELADEIIVEEIE